ncbi:MAG: MucR family transcriptional regulator [Alphaproteobacteria bacterium]
MANDQSPADFSTLLLRMTADIAASYVGNHKLTSDQIPEVIKTIFGALSRSDVGRNNVAIQVRRPAVPVRQSITPDFLICLEDGRKIKMLKRHLRATYKLTPDEYRAKWGLPSDYPMVAPNYSGFRSKFAKKIGLGRKPSSNRRRSR